MRYLIFVCVTTLGIQMANTQCLRPPPLPYNPAFNLLNRGLPSIPEPIRETNNFLPPQPRFINSQPTVINSQPTVINSQPTVINPQPTVISEPPCNSLVPIPNVVSEPSTTLITDCSPTICKNLANTIQLMIVCNLLQNSQGNSEAALQLAAPIINEVLSSPTLSCGCANPISTNLISPNVISPSVISPNVISPSVISANQLSPRVVSPSVCPNSAQVNNNGLLNTLMGLLGNIQG